MIQLFHAKSSNRKIAQCFHVNWLFALFVLLVCLTGATHLSAQKRVRFPGPKIHYRSADGRYEVYNVDPSADDQTHKILLYDRVQKNSRELLSYGRHVDVLWSPTGSRLAITDFAGSNLATVLVYDFSGGYEPVDLDFELRKRMPSDRDVFENHHCYVEARGWLDSNRLKLKVWGYGDRDPSGFTLWLEYQIGSGIRVLGRKRRVS